MEDTSIEERPTPRRLLKGPVAWVALFVALIGILGARKPDMFMRPQFWAEDGMFFYDAYVFGLESVWRPYAGYLHVIPRCVALAVDQFDPGLAPNIYVIWAALTTAWVGFLGFSRRFPFRSRWLCGLAIVLVPDAAEVLLTMANLQWILASGLVAILVMDDPRNGRQRLHDAVAVGAIGLTGPFIAMVAPLFIGRAIVRRTSASALLAGIATITTALQLVYVFDQPGAAPVDSHVQLSAAGPALGARLAGSLLLGQWVPNPIPPWLGWGLAILTAAGIGWLGVRSGHKRAERLWLGLAFTMFIAASVYRCRYSLPSLENVGFGSRYFFPPQVFALWLVAGLAAENRMILRTSGIVLFCLMICINAPRLREPALDDLRWTDYRERIRTGDAVTIPIHPHGWRLDLPARK